MGFFEYWFLFPITLLIATVATAMGIEVLGCLAPLLLAGLNLPVELAVAAGLVTAACTCSSAAITYLPTGLIDYKLGLKFLAVFGPAALFGALLGGVGGAFWGERWHVTVLGVSLFPLAGSFLRTPQKLDIILMNQTIEQVYGGKQAATRLTTPHGESLSYTPANLGDGWGIAAIAGVFMGLVANGFGELNCYYWIQRCRIPSQVAIATSTVVLAISLAIASLGYGGILFFHRAEGLLLLPKVLLFTIPGGIIGGQLGSILGEQMPLLTLERIAAGVFSLLGIWILSGILF